MKRMIAMLSVLMSAATAMAQTWTLSTGNLLLTMTKTSRVALELIAE